MKDYLGYENARNKQHAALYNAIMQKALGLKTDVLIGHHLCFEIGGDITTENEIPSADTLIFDHDIMDKVFGALAHRYMSELARVPAEKRDDLLQRMWDAQVEIDSVLPDHEPLAMSAATE